MCGLTFLGVWGGIRLQQRFLRNYLHLKLFGYDDGMDPPVWEDPETKKVLLSGRDPIEDQGKRERIKRASHVRSPIHVQDQLHIFLSNSLPQDGCFFSVFFVTTMTWWIGLKIYNGFLLTLRGDDKHQTDSGMYGLTFASYNLILGGLFTFVCDWYTLVAIVDQMLQSVHNGATKSDRNNGYLAYADTGSVTVRSKAGNIMNTTLAEAGGETKDKSNGCLSKKNGSGTSNDAAPTPPPPPGTFNERTAERLRSWASWWHLNRVVATRAVLLVGWPTVCVAYLVNYFKIMRALSGDPEAGVTVGESLWSRESNTEFARSKHRSNPSEATRSHDPHHSAIV